jgi:hypothetical protein
MKKLYFIFFTAFLSGQIDAQTYTLTSSNHQPIVGDSYGALTVDTNSTPLPMHISGAGVTWSITALTLTDSIVALNTFSTAATYSNSANYANTNLVQYDSTTTTYFNSSTNMVELTGVDAGQFDLNYNAGNATIAMYPMAFGFSNTDNTVGGDMSVVTPFGPATGTFTGTVTTQVDGTGTLNLNNISVFNNCVRLATMQNILFDLATPLGQMAGILDQTTYNFYNSSSKFPLFSVTYFHVQVPDAGIDQGQAQVTILSSVAIGVKENSEKEILFKAYPNPASDEVQLHFVLAKNESYTFEIVNAIGQVVKTVSMPNLHMGMYNETINTSDLRAGIYTIKVTGTSSHGTEKLVIQK